MTRSTLFLGAAAGLCAPAWFINVSALPFWAQFMWIGGMLLCALFGLAFRKYDRR
ncbi:hypothetical protein QTI66_06640 [Variovorax sp. J22R133]|uniref:hypothetical protein n=1 Tax=Variovorax brevis TaxID=3053503 RepID=UPI0025770D44|nr:hypothetical protein [Variovorax sp. J22R133]MDM0111821.1 hypothetical protein [Variovorax sp. J22R133]